MVLLLLLSCATDPGPICLSFPDADADGYGDSTAPSTACPAGLDRVARDGDCDDADALAYPGAAERCNGLDDDCDGVAESADECGHRDDVDLDDIGVRLDGGARVDCLGSWRAGTGDVDGDGRDDVLIGDSLVEANYGGAWLLFGPIEAGGSLAEAADAAFLGTQDREHAGEATALADLNGDGFADVVVAATSENDGWCGYVSVQLGPTITSRDLWSADVVLTGPDASICIGARVRAEGDADGDGATDLWVGNSYAPYDGEPSSVLPFRRVSNLAPGTRVLDDAATTLWVPAKFDPGEVFASAGDLDGDGLSDIAVCGQSRGTPGWLFVVTDLPAGEALVEDVAETTIVADEASPLDYCSVSTSGDVNGDGYDDVALGAPYATSQVGAAWIFLGPPDADRLDDADTRVLGGTEGARAGSAVELVGGWGGRSAALAIGAPYDATASGSGGSVGVWYDPPAGALEYASADALFFDEASGATGVTLSGAGDLDGDGVNELIAGAPTTSEIALNAGAIWIIPGR